MRILVAIAVSCFLFGACAAESTPAETKYDKIAKLTGDAANGKTIFDSNCAGCHGADGKSGSAGPNLVEGALTALTTAQMAQSVVDGKGIMPAFTQLSNQEVADVVAYVKGPLAGN